MGACITRGGVTRRPTKQLENNCKIILESKYLHELTGLTKIRKGKLSQDSSAMEGVEGRKERKIFWQC